MNNFYGFRYLFKTGLVYEKLLTIFELFHSNLQAPHTQVPKSGFNKIDQKTFRQGFPNILSENA